MMQHESSFERVLSRLVPSSQKGWALRRYYLFRSHYVSVYLHRWFTSDPKDEYHTHPFMLAARLQKLWEESSNHHDHESLKYTAARLGVTLEGPRGAKAVRS